MGVITPAEVKKVPRERWDQSSVQSVMRPLNQLRSVSPEMPAFQALELMARDNAYQLAVVANGKLQGIFSRDQVLRFLQLHAGFGAEPPAKMAA